MARPTPTQHDVLDDINSFADRLRDWIAANPVPVIAGAAVVLLAAGSLSAWRWWDGRREDRAAMELAKLDEGYRTAMGAMPGSIEIQEPANPETARATRREYATKYLDLASSEAGSTAAIVARLSAAARLDEVGDDPKALEELRATLPLVGSADPLRGLVLDRIASAEESAGNWKAAAEAYAEAASLTTYPLRSWAKAEAARCFAQAGDLGRAAAFARELAAEPEATQGLPPHLQAELAEIRARAPEAPEAPAAP